MIKHIKIFTFLFVLLGIFFASWVWAADDFEELCNSAQNIKTLSADFIQEKHLKILVKPIISKGRLYFKAPRSIRWEYLAPMKSLTLMNKGDVQAYIWSEGGWVLDKAENNARGIVMDEINGWFTGRFHENPAFTYTYKPGPLPSVILTPKEGVKNLISQIVLRFSKTTGLVETIKIIENQDNYTKVTFENEKLNADLHENMFEKP